METYLISMKQNPRPRMTLAHAIDLIRDIHGLEIANESNPWFVIVQATQAAKRLIDQRLGETCDIEKPVRHELLG